MTKYFNEVGMKKVMIYSLVAMVLSAVMIYATGELFNGKLDIPQVVGTDQAGASLEAVKKSNAMAERRMNNISKGLFIGIFLMQMVALVAGASVITAIKDEQATGAGLKLKKLDNAEIFMDLPLYLGLFGTVSSFIIMAVNPGASRLVAYSSTLIGIIISVVLRTSMLFPLRQRLVAEADKKA